MNASLTSGRGRIVYLAGIAILIFGCAVFYFRSRGSQMDERFADDSIHQRQNQKATIAVSQWETDGQMGKVPPIELEITMSEDAKRLVDSGYVIRLDFAFEGDGISQFGEHTAPHLPVILGSHSTLISGPGKTVIRDARVPLVELKRLTDANFEFYVNVVDDPELDRDDRLHGRASGQVLDRSVTSLRIFTSKDILDGDASRQTHEAARSSMK